MRKAREGRIAELAVAQNLSLLIADDAMVFRDFPCDGFNIDHIVIGRGAVFAVETKSRRKPPSRGSESAKVIYDGARLTFPQHTETRPLEQAEAQAKWLERFLASGTCESVRIVPVLALPGWFVENTAKAKAPVLVSNCRNPAFMSSEKFGPTLPEAMRKRIAHVLSERYPLVEI
jgi:hypothetical protein